LPSREVKEGDKKKERRYCKAMGEGHFVPSIMMEGTRSFPRIGPRKKLIQKFVLSWTESGQVEGTSSG